MQADAQSEPWPSVSQLEQEGVSQLLLAEAGGQLQQRYTYLYASAPDLRIDDVPVLLKQYKELVLKHEALVCAVEAHRAKQESGATSSQSQSASQEGAGMMPVPGTGSTYTLTSTHCTRAAFHLRHLTFFVC